MAVYDYVAIGADGKRATGVITADSAVLLARNCDCASFLPWM